jgi:hypothetical protein
MDAFDSKKLFRILAEVPRRDYHCIGPLIAFTSLVDALESLKLFRNLIEVSFVIMSILKLRTCSGFLFITVPRGASSGWIIGYVFIMYFEFTNLVKIRAKTPR